MARNTEYERDFQARVRAAWNAAHPTAQVLPERTDLVDPTSIITDGLKKVS